MLPKKKSLLAKIKRRIHTNYLDLLKVDRIRFYICKFRWLFLKKNLRIYRETDLGVMPTTIEYNLTAFQRPDAAFGMGKRMGLVLYPLAALLRDNPTAKVLIVGPRTEDDILWARSLGLVETRGLDLFSYSSLIDIGNMHKTEYSSQSYDAIVLGWVLAYSTDPEGAIKECKRLLKPGGLLAIGMESIDAVEFPKILHKRANPINTMSDLTSRVQEKVVFINDPPRTDLHEISVIFRMN